MENNAKEKSVVYSFSLISSAISIIIMLYLFSKIFYGIKTTTFATSLILFSITVPLIKFFINYIFVSKFKDKKKNYILIPLTNSILLPIILLIELFIIFTVDGIVEVNLAKLFFIVLSFLLSNSATEIILSPYLVEIFNKYERIDFVKLGIISTVIIGIELYLFLLSLIVYNHNISNTFPFWELLVISILGGVISVIILRKTFSMLYSDLKNVRYFILEGEEVENKVISKNFEIILNKIKDIILLNQNSKVNLFNSVKSIHSDIDKMVGNLLEIETEFLHLRNFIKDLKLNSNRDFGSIKEIGDNLEIIMNKSEDLIKQIEFVQKSKEETENFILKISPLLISLKKEIYENGKFLSSLLFNLKKVQEISLKLKGKVPEIISDYQGINDFVKNLTNLATKINFIRVSFDIELSKTTINKTNRDKLSIISQKLDLLFKNILSVTEKISIGEDKSLLEESVKKMVLSISEMVNEVEVLLNDIKNAEESFSKLFSTISDLKMQINKVYENLSFTSKTLKNFTVGLKSNFSTTISFNLKDSSNLVKTLDEIEKEIENFLQFLRDHINKLKSSEDVAYIILEDAVE